VIDSRLDLPLDAKILMGEPPIVLTVSGDAARRAALEAKGAEVVVVPRQGEKTDLDAIARLLGDRAFNEVTVETGGKLMGSLLRARRRRRARSLHGALDPRRYRAEPLRAAGDRIARRGAPAAHRRRSHDRAGRAHHRAFPSDVHRHRRRRGRIADVQPQGEGLRLRVEAPDLGMDDVAIGDSIAIQGVCHTVVAKSATGFESIRRGRRSRYAGLEKGAT
jgi:hypothetical protein